MSAPGCYALYAIRYAHNPHRRVSHNFIFADPHDGPMPMDYFVWLAVGDDRFIVIDMGFTAETAARRKHEFFRCPSDGIRALDVDPKAVGDVVITHMHWDHVGNFDKFPNATFHIQDDEVRYVTGRDVHWKGMKAGVMIDEVCTLIRNTYEDRVAFHDGTGEVAPGLTVHRVGGHTHGMQIARVRTQRGWVVVASDAAHYYANMERRDPFPAVHHVGEYLTSFDIALSLAESEQHIIPGHDPLVMQRYPAPGAGLEGVAVRLDVDPA
ncbi:MAG: N-acyl homoserine lactonase family protein [Alphaproteobacteria bacterium]|nr:N-acyl homoserine lactonase family protein [Alphaproteobacteria bacterium]